METCCCGCTLETGTTVIAILGLMFGGTGFLGGCVMGAVPLILPSLLEVVSCGFLLFGTL